MADWSGFPGLQGWLPSQPLRVGFSVSKNGRASRSQDMRIGSESRGRKASNPPVTFVASLLLLVRHLSLLAWHLLLRASCDVRWPFLQLFCGPFLRPRSGLVSTPGRSVRTFRATRESRTAKDLVSFSSWLVVRLAGSSRRVLFQHGVSFPMCPGGFFSTLQCRGFLYSPARVFCFNLELLFHPESTRSRPLRMSFLGDRKMSFSLFSSA